MQITTLYETEDLLVVAKPPGVVVVPARGEDPAESLRHRLEAMRAEALWVVHRIDRDTSGVLVFARNATAHRTLSMAFEARTVRKRYVALTRGAPPRDEGTIDTPLHDARKGKMRPALAGERDALDARTSYVVRARWRVDGAEVCLVDASPLTGRQHQVRVHLRSVGAPLLVDALYGRSTHTVVAGVELTRLTLHAACIELPWKGARLTIEAPLAEDLARAVTALSQGGVKR